MGVDPNAVVNGTKANGGAGEVRVRVPVVLGLQPSALVDHVAKVDWSLLDQILGYI